ncbi:hypothetical protein CcaverHIS002_0500710 [Cutaneotrichosporon cavernicola]|uniref:Velvet domain-containing protein n=1 Tax=Cutaneotrichosporon cavernicola TaxID=279322 RepID=A0AA48L7X9_9TREE|nr:uncharacterized protein CcaverHIS019_0600710 [Cutaneotrichosporon cavernicola]BEI84670.1 hypothetical protein CcaverHIS002_0500710 [Cutaneotrichosporon cavernicola]BEI93612.1 hypothetical protein CcaverHIS019_0600710 [Cutaneotrichosporon cavernicola]BEJ01389.1 hypothetical protein CcaverHIS631_0600710 [Cutaneotrichosporon cavernicola]BEJ09156.1 hypothetical protein CcaverHIS641_0600710 [Cutaneotrichosporon cavernicola]
MSFCLQVAQEPVAGRRKTDKDRRPIAPTPIIRLWIREHAGATGLGVFVNPSDINISTLPGRGRAKAFDKSHRNLHGRLHVEANRVIDMEGEMGLWFLFMSLSVRNEGTYSLYFRCFDRSATTKGMPPAPSLAACRSMDFKVFSPRNYHGRPPKTLLADHFNRQGFKLNTRKNERQVASPSPPPE